MHSTRFSCKLSLSGFTALAALSCVQPALADAETEALRAQIKALEARLDQIEKGQHATHTMQKAAAEHDSAHSDHAHSTAHVPTGDVYPEMNKRLAIVERNQEIALEEAKSKAQTSTKVEYNDKGVTITSPDKQYQVNFQSYIQADNRAFFQNGANGPTNQFLIRSMRPIINGKMTDYFNARFMVDFARTQAQGQVLDAFADFHPMPGSELVNARIGVLKVPLGIERWQSEVNLLFVERGQTNNLVPFRDTGFMLYGQLIPDQLDYHLGITNGASDLQVNTSDIDNSKDWVGRVMAHPLKWAGVYALQGLGVGVAGSYGERRGNASTTGLPNGFNSTGQRLYFTYRNSAGNQAFANGTQWRFNPQFEYYNGSLGSFGEYIIDNQEVGINGASRDLRNTAWMALASYVLTGEDADFNGVKPRHAFNPRAGDWGAVEVVGRYSALHVDKDAFPLFADPSVSSRAAWEGTVGVNWYFNSKVKLNVDFAMTAFDGGSQGGKDHTVEKAVLSRAQVRF